MKDRKRQTWNVYNPNDDYIVVRTKREADKLEREMNNYNLGLYFVCEGNRMTDYELKHLPELDCF